MNTKRAYKRVDENVLGQLLNLRVRGASYKRAAEALGRSPAATQQLASMAEISSKSTRELLQLTAKDAYAAYRKNVRLAFESRKAKPEPKTEVVYDLEPAFSLFDAAMAECKKDVFIRRLALAVAFALGADAMLGLIAFFMHNM